MAFWVPSICSCFKVPSLCHDTDIQNQTKIIFISLSLCSQLIQFYSQDHWIWELFYNACSLASIGYESLTACLKILTSIELYLNTEFYSDHPYIESLITKKSSINKKNAFYQCLSFKAIDSSSLGNQNSAIYKEAENNVIDHTFSSFLCMLSLSSVIEMPIEAYFQITDDENFANDKLTLCELFFNGCIYP